MYDQRGVRLRGNDKAHGEAIGARLGIIRQALEEVFSETQLPEIPFLGNWDTSPLLLRL